MSVNTHNIKISGIANKWTAEYIANQFWRQHIAKVSSITFMPYLNERDEIYKIAYITIASFCDTEIAYNFIKRLNKNMEARLVFNDDDYWIVELNNHNDGNIIMERFTSIFTDKYYDKLESNVTLRPHQKAFKNKLLIGIKL